MDKSHIIQLENVAAIGPTGGTATSTISICSGMMPNDALLWYNDGLLTAWAQEYT